MADIASRLAEIERKVKKRLEDIEENNVIVRGIKRLSDENRVYQVRKQCEEMRCEDLGWDDEWNYLQQELNITFNMRDQEVKNKELGDVIFYYLLQDEEPNRDVQYLIWMITYNYNEYGHNYNESHSWYESTCGLMSVPDLFTQLLRSNIEYLIDKRPQLLLNQNAMFLVNRLSTHLPHDQLRHILLNTRNESRETVLFYTSIPAGLYRHHIDELCQLLSVQNTNGQTALHANTNLALNVLLEYYTLNNQDKLFKLLSIRDNNNITVYEAANGDERLTWLNYQYQHGHYPLYHDPKVLILYNETDREGAEEEAKSIQQAFKSVTDQIDTKKMGTKRDVLRQIRQAAASSASILIVCVMSHGGIGTIEDSNRKLMTFTSIEGEMDSKELKERPKILIAQSCQAREDRVRHVDTGASNTDRPQIAEQARNIPYEPVADHFMSVQSCVSGQESERNILIPYLGEQIEKSSEDANFLDVVTTASRKMLEDGKKQIPIVKSTLRAKICLRDQFTQKYRTH